MPASGLGSSTSARAWRRARAGCSTTVGLDLRPDGPARHAAHLRAATGRDRPRAVARRPRADHGRADGGAVAARGRAAVRGRRRPAAARRGDDVRRPPHGRDLPRRRPHRGAARRPPRRRSSRPPSSMRDRAVAADGRPRRSSAIYPDAAGRAPATVVLAASGLSRDGAFHDVSFTLRAGEILGFGGLVGSGRTEIARVLFGIDQPTAGTIAIDGKPVALRLRPRRHGSAASPMSRRTGIGQSLVMDFSILANASLPVLDKATWPASSAGRASSASSQPHLERLRLRFRSLRPAGQARCPAATSRRSCCRSGWRPSRACSSSTSRRRASTCRPRPRSTR